MLAASWRDQSHTTEDSRHSKVMLVASVPETDAGGAVQRGRLRTSTWGSTSGLMRMRTLTRMPVARAAAAMLCRSNSESTFTRTPCSAASSSSHGSLPFPFNTVLRNRHGVGNEPDSAQTVAVRCEQWVLCCSFVAGGNRYCFTWLLDPDHEGK